MRSRRAVRRRRPAEPKVLDELFAEIDRQPTDKIDRADKGADTLPPAAKFLARRFGLSLMTATTVAALAGLGGPQ